MKGLINKPVIDIIVDEVPGRKQTVIRDKEALNKVPTFYDRESVSGKVIINLNKLKKFEHTGIKIELLGVIEQLNNKGNASRFITLTRDLEPQGFLTNEITTLPFNFSNVEKQYETYRGTSIQVRYLLKASIAASVRDIGAEIEFGVINPDTMVTLTKDVNPIKLEVGIEDWLHLIFEVEKNKYHLKDIVSGQVTFKKVSIKLKSMEVQIIKRETLGAGKISIVISRKF